MHLGKTLSVSEQKVARGSAWFASKSLVCRYVRSWYFSGHANVCASSSDPFVVRSATMAEKRRGPPSRGGPYIWLPRLTDDALCDAGTQTDRRVEDMTTAVDILIKYQRTYNKKYTQEEADDLVQKALMRDRAETLQLYFEMLPEVASCCRNKTKGRRGTKRREGEGREG